MRFRPAKRWLPWIVSFACIVALYMAIIQLPKTGRQDSASRTVLGSRQLKGGTVARLVVRSHLSEKQLDEKVVQNERALLAVLDGMIEKDFESASRLRGAKRKLRSILGPEAKVVSIQLDRIQTVGRPVDPELLEKLKELPGTLGYLDSSIN